MAHQSPPWLAAHRPATRSGGDLRVQCPGQALRRCTPRGRKNDALGRTQERGARTAFPGGGRSQTMPDRPPPIDAAFRPDPPGGDHAASPGLEIRLFGPVEARIGSQPLPRLRPRKGLRLLALLALRAGREVERDWLAALLWPDCDEAHGRRSLRQSLHDRRLALGSHSWRLAVGDFESPVTAPMADPIARPHCVARRRCAGGGRQPPGLRQAGDRTQVFSVPGLASVAVLYADLGMVRGRARHSNGCARDGQQLPGSGPLEGRLPPGLPSGRRPPRETCRGRYARAAGSRGL